MAWAVNRPAAGTAYSLPSRLFPVDNWWNLDISAAPVDPNSDTFILGTPSLFPVSISDYNYRGYGVGPAYTSKLRTDWGNNYGMPYCTVSGDHPVVYFTYTAYSGGASGDDTRGYPIPEAALTEVGWTEDLVGTVSNPAWLGPTGAFKDRHLLIFDVDHQYLYEIYQPYYNATSAPTSGFIDPVYPQYGTIYPYGSGVTIQPGTYVCKSCSFWDATTNNVRPIGVTSSDAAGLQVLPGLLQYDEIVGTAPITHAHRMCVAYHSDEDPRYVWPATHWTTATLKNMPPLGARLRLKASYDMSLLASSYYDQFRKLAVSLQTYGGIVADNGGHGMLNGTNDARWGAYDSAIRLQGTNFCNQIKLSDFEIVELGWNPTATSSYVRLSWLGLDVPSLPYQYARPTADLDAGTWVPSSGSTLAPMLDETIADDADDISSTGSGVETALLRLRGANRPIAGPIRLRVRAKRH
jgi:hypothetical protein